MDINLLTISIGNSRVGLGVFAEGKLEQTARIALDHDKNLSSKIADAWRRIAAGDRPEVAVVSVNHARDEQVEQIVQTVTGQAIQWIPRDIALPIAVKTKPPTATGIDRVLNIAAAYEQMQKACIVVDAGTAVTVDVCNDAGEFLGGAIAPGAAMMLGALHEKIGALPKVALAQPKGVVGESTESAMLHGVYHGIRGMVKELAERYAMELGSWPEIIATGGDAQVLFEGWELVHAVAPDLLFYGIALAYVNHHTKPQK